MGRVTTTKTADGGKLYGVVGTAMPIACVGYDYGFVVQHLHEPDFVLSREEAKALRKILKVWLDE